MKTWNVALAQMKPVFGNVSANLEKHLHLIIQAREASAQLVVFPELSLTGYSLMDRIPQVYRSLDDADIRQIVSESRSIDIVFGFYERGEDYVPYITSVYASGGNITHAHRKVYTPTYGMFDEARFVGAGRQFRAFDTGGFRSGILICEDAWHLSAGYILGQDRAMCLIVPCAGPSKGLSGGASFQSVDAWKQLLALQAKIYQVYILYVNRIGFEEGVCFGGGSCVIGPDGSIRTEAGSFEEELILYELLEADLRKSRYQMPSVRDEKLDVTLRELARIVNERNQSTTEVSHADRT